MSTWRKTMLVTVSAVAILFGGGVAAMAAGRSPAADVGMQALTPVQERDWQFTREEERMARDLYKLFADKYDALPIFDRISWSEQVGQHHVQQNHGRLLPPYPIHRIGTSGRLDDTKALSLQIAPQHPADLRLVVNDEHLMHPVLP